MPTEQLTDELLARFLAELEDAQTAESQLTDELLAAQLAEGMHSGSARYALQLRMSFALTCVPMLLRAAPVTPTARTASTAFSAKTSRTGHYLPDSAPACLRGVDLSTADLSEAQLLALSEFMSDIPARAVSAAERVRLDVESAPCEELRDDEAQLPTPIGGIPRVLRGVNFSNLDVDALSPEQLEALTRYMGDADALEVERSRSGTVGRERLPVSVLTAADVSRLLALPDVELECVICMDALFTVGAALRTLTCMHRFHAECIDEWMDGHSECPTCQHR